eukprot:863823-Pelagomonas_calceolata.AAC.1
MFMHKLFNPLLGSHVRPHCMLLRHLQLHVLVHKHTEIGAVAVASIAATVPETKGKTLEEIEAMWGTGRS